MSTVLVPTRTDLPHYTEQVKLDDTVYQLEFRWNTREAAWYMSIQTDIDEELLDSVKIVVGGAIGWNGIDTRLPAGIFIAIDTSGTDTDPGLNDLGDRVQLYYIPGDGT